MLIDTRIIYTYSPVDTTGEYYMKKPIKKRWAFTTENILEFASKDVDIISLGEITQKAKGLDISLEVIKKVSR